MMDTTQRNRKSFNDGKLVEDLIESEGWKVFADQILDPMYEKSLEALIDKESQEDRGVVQAVRNIRLRLSHIIQQGKKAKQELAKE